MVFTYNNEPTLAYKKSQARKKSAERRKEEARKLADENKQYNYTFLLAHLNATNPELYETLRQAA